MGVGFFHSSDPSNVHAELEDWLAKARIAIVGQKVVSVSGQGDNTVIIHFENKQALVFTNHDKALGRLVASIPDEPAGSPSSN